MDPKNNRKHKRVDLDLVVRFVGREDLEATGRITNISEGGFAMITDSDAQVGDEIIAYPEGLGRLTGVVKRRTKDGLAVEFDVSELQRARLKKRITSALTGVPYIRFLEKREHKRIALNLEAKAENTETGECFDCEIHDLSESGAQIRAKTRPALGALIKIGAVKGCVCRHTSDGFAISFSTTANSVEACA